MSAPKITLVGAGGMSFGPAMVNDIVHTPSLAGARLVERIAVKVEDVAHGGSPSPQHRRRGSLPQRGKMLGCLSFSNSEPPPCLTFRRLIH